MTKQKKKPEMTIKNMEKVDTTGFFSSMSRIEGLWRAFHPPPPTPFPHTHGKPSNQHMRNFIKLDSRMYMSAEWNVAETIVSEVVL